MNAVIYALRNKETGLLAGRYGDDVLVTESLKEAKERLRGLEDHEVIELVQNGNEHVMWIVVSESAELCFGKKFNMVIVSREDDDDDPVIFVNVFFDEAPDPKKMKEFRKEVRKELLDIGIKDCPIISGEVRNENIWDT